MKIHKGVGVVCRLMKIDKGVGVYCKLMKTDKGVSVTLTTYFINPSGKLKLSFDRTTKNISQ